MGYFSRRVWFSLLLTQEAEENVRKFLWVGILQNPQHNPIDNLDKIIQPVLIPPSLQLLSNSIFILIFMNKLCDGKLSGIINQVPDMLNNRFTSECML